MTHKTQWKSPSFFLLSSWIGPCVFQKSKTCQPHWIKARLWAGVGKQMRVAYHTLQRAIPRGAKTIHPDTHAQTHTRTGSRRFTQNRRHILGCISHDVFNVQPNTVQYQTLQTFTQCKSNLDTLTYIHFCTHTHTQTQAHRHMLTVALTSRPTSL